jgi:hypothetical protein
MTVLESNGKIIFQVLVIKIMLEHVIYFNGILFINLVTATYVRTRTVPHVIPIFKTWIEKPVAYFESNIR